MSNVGIIHYCEPMRAPFRQCESLVHIGPRCAEANEQVEEADKQALDGRMIAGWQGMMLPLCLGLPQVAYAQLQMVSGLKRVVFTDFMLANFQK